MTVFRYPALRCFGNFDRLGLAQLPDNFLVRRNLLHFSCDDSEYCHSSITAHMAVVIGEGPQQRAILLESDDRLCGDRAT